MMDLFLFGGCCRCFQHQLKANILQYNECDISYDTGVLCLGVECRFRSYLPSFVEYSYLKCKRNGVDDGWQGWWDRFEVKNGYH